VHTSTVLRRLTVGAGSLALVAGLAGCSGSGSSEPSGGLAIVVGAHSNMPAPSLDGAAQDALETAVRSQSYLAMVVVDGAPFALDAAGPLLASDANDVAKKADWAKNRRLVAGALDAAAAKAEEADLLTALDEAARSISSAGGAHTIVVVDSGLSTVGPLDFRRTGLLDADPAELAAGLQAAHELPDLAGADVVFEGLGDTAAPQPPVGRAQRTNLVAIWTAVAKAAGAGSVTVEESPLGGPATPGLPAVSVVPVSSGVQCTASTVTLTGGDVAFQPDSATFVDPAAASQTLKPVAQQMVDAGFTATVSGMTADVGDLAGRRTLSRQRAQAVADVLVALGVPADRMTVAGLGSEFPGYVQDHDVDGNLVADKAAANRKVVIELAGASADVTCALG
jgi:outer membrane protein OmpA-like peptidoglycan-associated protein